MYLVVPENKRRKAIIKKDIGTGLKGAFTGPNLGQFEHQQE